MGVAVHVPRDHCLAPERVDAPIGEGGRYGRMFDLPALEADEKLLLELGAAGGFCDGGDRADDAQLEAGWPFFGQYVAHDLTADRSPLRAHTDLQALRNMRSPRANLESLYGGGPAGQDCQLQLVPSSPLSEVLFSVMHLSIEIHQRLFTQFGQLHDMEHRIFMATDLLLEGLDLRHHGSIFFVGLDLEQLTLSLLQVVLLFDNRRFQLAPLFVQGVEILAVGGRGSTCVVEDT